jgi:hypothetical protein
VQLQDGSAAQMLTLGLGDGDPFTLALADHVPLKLRRAAEYCEHQLGRR